MLVISLIAIEVLLQKKLAKQMANSLPGCPIVGYYNEGDEILKSIIVLIDISNGKFEIKDTTNLMDLLI